VVFHLHEKVGRFGRLLVRAMATADCTVFCAANCADHYAPVPALRRRTILNAIVIPETGPARAAASRMKIVMLGSINRDKGQDLLLRAFALLDRHDAELHFYGTVGLSARGFVQGLKKFVRENALSDRVFFPGPTHDAAGVFREATLLVHSSLNECLSISVLEAMSYGVPVIANDIPGMGEIITNGVDGILVRTGDVNSLARTMALLLDDSSLREKLGRAGRNTVRKRFDMAVRAQEFVSLYQVLTRTYSEAGNPQ
jgi:glycosyltransferase involved in cell wall biosynthesis